MEKNLYRCTNCGMLNESADGNPPSRCEKCENSKFYKVGK